MNALNIINIAGVFLGFLLISLPDISKWNTINVNNMGYIFETYSILKSLSNISKWNSKNTNNKNYIFYHI